MVNLRLVQLTLLASGSGFRLILIPGFPYGEGTIQVPGNLIPDSLMGIFRFLGSHRIGISSTPSSFPSLPVF